MEIIQPMVWNKISKFEQYTPVYISLSSDPVNGFSQVESHFWVLFQGQSYGEVIVHIIHDEVTVHINWHGKTQLHNFWQLGIHQLDHKLRRCVFPSQLMCTVTSPLVWPWKTTPKLNNCFICTLPKLHDIFSCIIFLYLTDLVSNTLSENCLGVLSGSFV